MVLSLHVLRVKSDEMRLWVNRVKSKERAQKHREKREKKSDEMKLREKNRQYILGGPGPANSFFNRIQKFTKRTVAFHL